MKYLIGLIVGVILAVAGVAVASNLQPDIDGAGDDGWISIGDYGSKIKRINDKDNNIVCWIYMKGGGYSSAGGISCVKH
jgi:hypothetical protein